MIKKRDHEIPRNIGQPYAWLVAVALNQIHGLQPEEQKPTLEMLRGGKQLFTRWHTESLKMKTGDKVPVHSGKSFTDDATIESLCHPDELPAIANAPNVAAVRAILAEGAYIAVALITYKFLDEPVAFVALQNTRGEWFDLKGQQLIIEPRTAENEIPRQKKEPRPFIATRRSRVDYGRF